MTARRAFTVTAAVAGCAFGAACVVVGIGALLELADRLLPDPQEST